ncbi:MAG: DUF5615 family PIN-like protein [Anaerolineae bacterium]|nr:DUF5615 family PIN-like protein [Anaerolineae bacterium]
MADDVRFYLDEHIAHAIRDGLRRRGVDVLTPLEAGRVGLPDEQQPHCAQAEGRVVVTHDSNFLALHHQGVSHAGIAYCPFGKLTVGDMIFALELIHSLVTPDEMRNHVEYL